jgi:uncharacterized membrane protein
MENVALLEKRLQVAGTLLILGLVIEALCLLWAKPITFVLFVAVGGVLLFAGVAVYLYSVVSTPRS